MYDLTDQAEIEAQTIGLIEGKDTIDDVLEYQREAENCGVKPWMNVAERQAAREAWLATPTRDAFAFPISGDVIAEHGHLRTTAHLWPMVHESTDEGLGSGDGYFGLPRTAAWQAVVDQSMGRRYYLRYHLVGPAGYPGAPWNDEVHHSMMSALVRLTSLMLDHGDALTRVRLVSRIG